MFDILFVNHLKLGSASSYRQAGFAKYLRETGNKSSLICRTSNKSIEEKNPPEKGSIDRIDYPQYNDINYWKEPLARRFFSNVRSFSNISKVNKIVHANRANPYTATIISAARSSNYKLVVDMEDWDGFGGYSSYTKNYNAKGVVLSVYEDLFPRTADLVVVVSQLLRDLMIRAGVPSNKILLVPNGFEPSIFNPKVSGKEAREKYRLFDNPVVIYSSTFWKFEKWNHEVALGAFRKIQKSVPEVRFLLVGSGNVAMQSMIEQYGLEKNAVATGFVPREEVPQLMAAADVAMHVISRHGFHAASSPMIISEYMAVGKAIVAPRVGELANLLGGEEGFLVEEPDSELLADGVVKLLKNDALRKEMGARAASKALSDYSYSVLAKKLEKSYNDLLN